MTSRCVFRVAAGPRIGFGHLMRARALAECLPMPAVFSVRGGANARRTARDLGCEVVSVRLKPDTTDVDATDHDSMRLRAGDLLVVDDPRRACGRPWIDAARRAGAASLSVHDDRATLPADVVVRGSIDATTDRAAARELVGPSFYVLNRRVLIARRARAARASRSRSSAPYIVIALGGGQHVRSAAQPIVTAIRQRLPRARIAVAPGFTSGTGRHRLPALDGGHWLRPSGRLVEALVDADVAIVAGGVTLYEACAIGVPTIACAVVPAQRRAIRAFAKQGAIVDAGDAGSIVASRTRQEQVAASVAALVNGGGGRAAAALSRRARTIVDGRGAERVSKQLLAGGRRG